MARSYIEHGSWNVVCQVCREKIKSSQATKRYDGLIVGKNHEGCFEYRHPLERPAPIIPKQRALPFTSPDEDQDAIILDAFGCTVEGSYAIADQAVAGCAVVDRVPI